MVNAEHMTSLFENATEGIILTNSKGMIVLVNPAAERIFDYNSSELIGKPIEVLLPDNIRGHHAQLREGFYHHPSNRSMGQGRDLYARKKDNSNIPVEVSLSYYNREGEMFVIAFIVDITGRKEIERNMMEQQLELERVSSEIRKLNSDLEAKVEERTMILREALQRLEQSQAELSEALDKERQLNEIKSRFVSMASHEFRTPLSTVLSSAALLSKYTKEDEQEKRTRHIEKIKNSVNHLNDILEDFLSLGKLDEGRVGTQISQFDLSELINDTIEEIKALLKHDQKVSMKYHGEKIISSDKKLLKNIFINLITNAIKFSDEGNVIEIHAVTTAHLATIEVKDRGIGISKDDQQHLFSSFFRGANVVNIAGTGLGLHIVKRYVDLLKGSVDLQSELGKGTTVTVNIPVNID
jgi:PAS domain S-box-containing protein